MTTPSLQSIHYPVVFTESSCEPAKSQTPCRFELPDGVRESRTLDDILGPTSERGSHGEGDAGAVFDDPQNPGFVIKVSHAETNDVDAEFAAVQWSAEKWMRFYGHCSAEPFVTADHRVCVRLNKVPGRPMRTIWPSEYGTSKHDIMLSIDLLQGRLVDVGLRHEDISTSNVHFDPETNCFWPTDFDTASTFTSSAMTPEAPSPGPLASDHTVFSSLRKRVSALMDSHAPEVVETYSVLSELVGQDAVVDHAWRCGQIFPDSEDDTRVYKPLFKFEFDDFAPGVETGPKELSRAVNEKRMFERYYGEGSADLIRTRNGYYLLRMKRVPGVTFEASALAPQGYQAAYRVMRKKMLAAGIEHPGLRPEHLCFDAVTQTLHPVSFASCRLIG
ncbi:hypothetical protein PAN31117_00937 [Pandoraea anapnoica]|uniref:Kinase OspG kinase domain-containing protein n=2 Tax=Pandoraea anapnoica TaxID=2508301 RepID=A0A5E4ZP94_9BURK|nr:hypothetical protein PAN31117_00937 [Pandoraea anapnoica]